ncbi:hypothetical protein Nmel_014440, partial [Mimus melanotis]
CSSGPPPALLPAVSCSLLAQPSGSGFKEHSQPCLHPGKELPCCWPPHTRDRRASSSRQCLSMQWQVQNGSSADLSKERQNL